MPKGYKHSEETKRKIGLSNKGKSRSAGAKHYNWKGGITPEERRIRKSPEYIEWRNKVFERDLYTCQMCCDNRGGNLNAHHLFPFAQYPQFRFDVDNGLTVCERCHCKLHDKPYSERKKRKKRRQTVGIPGVYQITQAGIEFLNRKDKNYPVVDGKTKCSCGCGAEFDFLDSVGRQRNYLSGHNQQSAATMNYILSLLIQGPMKLNKIIKLSGKTKASIKTSLCKMKKRFLIERKKENG